jgi:hypothetical protein
MQKHFLTVQKELLTRRKELLTVQNKLLTPRKELLTPQNCNFQTKYKNYFFRQKNREPVIPVRVFTVAPHTGCARPNTFGQIGFHFMNSQERQYQEIFIRVGEFGAQQSTAFPSSSIAGTLFADLAVVIHDLTEFSANESSQTSGKRRQQALKSDARDRLLQQMQAISRTAKAVALTVPNLEKKFVVRGTKTDRELISDAQAFEKDAIPFAEAFTRLALPADFLDRLRAAITDFETALVERHNVRSEKSRTGASIDSVIERGTTIVKQLDAIVKNTFEHDEATLVAWKRASHPEKARAKAGAQKAKAAVAGS